MKRNKKFLLLSCIIFLLILPGLLLGGLVFTYYFAFSTNEIRGRMMEPNYNDEEMYITNKLLYKFSKPKRYDVVVYKNPEDEKLIFLGRIIGLPGEEITLGTYILINGDPLEEWYTDMTVDIENINLWIEAGTISIPEGEYFILGDNRSQSVDSRKLGTIAEKKIVGKIWFCYAYCKD